MFSFHRPSGNSNASQAVTAREQASMQSLQEAFGCGMVGQTMQSLGESAPRSEVEHRHSASTQSFPHTATHSRMRNNLMPPGHMLEEHHICENCPQGRVRGHDDDMIRPVAEIPKPESVG